MNDEERREYRKNWLKKKYDTDPEWRAKQIARVKSSQNDRYKTDPVFRARKLAYAKERAQKNAALIAIYQKNYKAVNREKLNAQAAARKRKRYAEDPEYREKMRQSIRDLSGDPQFRSYMNAYRARRKLEDPSYVIKNNLARRIRLSLKGADKSANTETLLGCTIEQLRAHLLSLFTDGMTWENYGYYGWHVGHKKPCSAFQLDDPEQQKLCFHFTNLQPMWREENQSKGDTFLEIEADIVGDEIDEEDDVV